MEVTDVLRDRMHEPAGLSRMAAVSLGVHVAAFAALLLAPGTWMSRGEPEPRTVMTITLAGGGEGPRSGGMTAMAARPVQAEAPAAAKPEPVRPPAAAAPKMTVPTPTARPERAASKAVTQAPEGARGRTPTRGATTEAGNSLAVTGARGQGFGLSTGGGPGAGSSLDVADFCCPDYIVLMVSRIQGNWNQRQNIVGETMIKFTIQRDGTIQNVELERSSGYSVADLAAQRAVILTRQLPPLPQPFPNPTLTVHLNFQYQR